MLENTMADELGVITKARDLAEYIFLITDRSPKKFRLTLTARLQNLSLASYSGHLSHGHTWHLKEKMYEMLRSYNIDI